MHIINYITTHTNLPEKSVTNTIELLEVDCTIPFIARYRKEKTGNLDEVQIGLIVKFKDAFETLEKRKITILKSLEDQGMLTTELQTKIENITDLTALEDVYLPYKKKRKTKAETARKSGLEPLAKVIMSQGNQNVEHMASSYVKGNVESVEKALEGARHIIAEWINERIEVRTLIRKELQRFATISSKVIKSKENDEKTLKFKDYFDWSEPLNRIPSHRLLAILRAEKEGFVRVKIALDDHRVLEKIDRKIIKSNNESGAEVQLAIDDAYKRLLLPSLTTEALNLAKEKADHDAITVFSKNLEQLLLGAPLGEKHILALDPGFKTGCKVVCLNAQGELVHNDTIFPHPPQHKTSEARYTIEHLVKTYSIEAISIGNGTASRETERFIKTCSFDRNVDIFVVNEAGASIYSASEVARHEFPNKDITVRGAVSIGRRLADPLAELVKIEARSIGVGQYQHDVDQNKLKKSLDTVVESCVNKVGVNINTASASLLSYVSGIGPKLAVNIIAYRNEHGVFHSRNDIKNVKRLGGKAFEQSAGFLRIINGKNPLDNSAVHPEQYDLVTTIAKDLSFKTEDLIGNSKALKDLNLQHYATDAIGLLTLNDILKELEKPGLDPRANVKTFSFDDQIQSISDLNSGMILPGIVNNITNFGCFVDIGIKESGLIHVSNLSDRFVKDVNAHVTLQQQVLVKVLDVDVVRKRIQLKLEN